jgi:hypothetical protein
MNGRDPTSDREPDLLRELADASFDGRLDAAGEEALQSLVLQSDSARAAYVEMVHQHAALQLALQSDSVWLGVASRRPDPGPKKSVVRSRWFAVLCTLLVTLGVGWWIVPRETAPVATLVEAKSCKWDSGTLPTEVGSALKPGRLRLSEGLTRLLFASGAEVTLEGPADIELISPMKCIVRSGQLAAKVPPGAQGFVVETPTSVLTDFGTEFGVRVSDGNVSDVRVFTGRVDVVHRTSGQTKVMLTGAGLSFGEQTIRPFNSNADQRSEESLSADPPERKTVLRIPTSFGRGRDAFIQPIPVPENRRSETLLLVKNTKPSMSDWYRKAYLAFDLSGVAGKRFTDAELSVTFAPTGMGFAAQVPDATFAVYGLSDETLDSWDESTLKWANAPANRKEGDKLDAKKVVRLGSFVLPQGQQSGTVTLGGRFLFDFLKRDTNGIASIIIVRETQGSGTADLVHGIASRRHPTLSPPTLRLIDDGAP